MKIVPASELKRGADCESTCEQILGIAFFNGSVEKAVEKMIANGGLLVAPSGTCFERFMRDRDYRRAILSADVVLPDSGLMVSLWRKLRRRRIQRISGLAYLQLLLRIPQFEFRDVLWVLPNERSREKLLAWGKENGRAILPNECYLAPIYGSDVRDAVLLQKAESQRATQIVIGIGAGAQEKLGWSLRENLPHRPAIHCVAARSASSPAIRSPSRRGRIDFTWDGSCGSCPSQRYLSRDYGRLVSCLG